MRSEQETETLKRYFHYAKLSLHNVRLLGTLEEQRKTSSELAELLDAHAKRNALTRPVPLCHQATFVSHAYTTLVWLREYIGKHLTEKERTVFYDEFSRRFAVGKVDTRLELHCDQPQRVPNLKKANDFLRTVRNALAHARVDATDDCFMLTNTYTDRNDKDHWTASITLDWPTFGALCDASLFAYQEVLYPGTPGATQQCAAD